MLEVVRTVCILFSCCLQNGKESKKRSWQSFYVVLNGCTLYFWKDEKDKRKV